MDLRKELLARATQIATADGRSEPAVLDLVRAAIENGDSRTLTLVTMLDNTTWTRGHDLSPANEEELDDIFQRAAALAVALDQTLAPDHVAVVAARSEAAGPPGVLTAVRQVLIQAVAGPDEQEQLEMRQALEHMDDEASARMGWRTTKDLRTTLIAQEHGGFGDEVAAACPRCRRPLTSPLPSQDLDSDAGRITAVLCGNCGVVLGVLARP